MREAAFQKMVIDLAHLRKWRVAHFRPVRVATAKGTYRWQTPVQADGAGFPDLVLSRGGVVLFRELKTDNGKLSREQSLWLESLGEHGAVWTPKDWGKIQKELW